MLSANYFQNLIKVKTQKAQKEFIRQHYEKVKERFQNVAKSWKREARRLLSKPSSRHIKNTSLYPRKQSGALMNSVHYAIQSYKGTQSFSFKIAYGFKEVFSNKSRLYPNFPYGSYLNEKDGATYAHYRERINEKLAARIDKIVNKFEFL